jgi:hypothetical protein
MPVFALFLPATTTRSISGQIFWLLILRSVNVDLSGPHPLLLTRDQFWLKHYQY